jgi:hypothetical protein
MSRQLDSCSLDGLGGGGGLGRGKVQTRQFLGLMSLLFAGGPRPKWQWQ